MCGGTFSLLFFLSFFFFVKLERKKKKKKMMMTMMQGRREKGTAGGLLFRCVAWWCAGVLRGRGVAKLSGRRLVHDTTSPGPFTIGFFTSTNGH